MNLFDDGEVLGALVTSLLIILPLLIGVGVEKWRGKTPPSKDGGEDQGA